MEGSDDRASPSHQDQVIGSQSCAILHTSDILAYRLIGRRQMVRDSRQYGFSGNLVVKAGQRLWRFHQSPQLWVSEAHSC